MAAYAALVSLMYIINQIQHHRHPPISLDINQVESLTQNLNFLQDFLECYSLHFGYSKEADPLEMRIADAAYAAEDVIETHIVDQIHVGSINCGKRMSSIGLYEDLQKVINEMDSIKNEVMKNKKMNTTKQLQKPPPGSSRTSCASTRQIPMVGFDAVKLELIDKLLGENDRQIIPIVGMAGIGKTTLAKNIYQDLIVVRNFDILKWVTITQEYRNGDILSHLLKEGGEGSSDDDEHELGDKLYQRLYGMRYLIIMDDIWDIKVWEQLRRYFLDNQNGSRIVLTTRISNFRLSDSNYVLKMSFLDKDSSWILFSNSVFKGKGCCPIELEEIGEEIVEKCRGLPLSIIVVGGLLSRSEHTRDYWEYMAGNLNSIVNSQGDEHCLKVLHMSYNHLPVHLKPCFLYMGLFSEDKKIPISMLIRLWVAEGFLKPSNDGKSSEEIAKEYLMELIDRNMVLVHQLGCIGNVKNVHIHDLLRDLCLREAEKQRFLNVIRPRTFDSSQDMSNQRRVVISKMSYEEDAVIAVQSMSRARSLTFWDPSRGALSLHNFKLLRIMSYSSALSPYYVVHMLQLVNARYLAIHTKPHAKFHPSISRLWNLHTIVIENGNRATAPIEIWDMPQLRHFVSKTGIYLPPPPGGNTSRRGDIVLANLEILGRVINFSCCDEVVKRIPNVKKLKIYFDGIEGNFLTKLGELQKLESFHCISFQGIGDILHNHMFPWSLKRLTFSQGNGCTARSEDVLEIIGALPLLEKLIFMFGNFEGRVWETVEGQFRSLKFLKLVDCSGLEIWTTESSHFPRLEHLVLELLEELLEIPPEIGEITTLKSLKLVECKNSAVESAKKIQEDQEENFGEVSLQVQVQISDYDQIQELQNLFSSNFHLA